MPLFLWKKSYEIKVPDVDVQHRRLVGMINELSDAMMLQSGQRTVPHILEKLVDYVQLHFTSEESLMEKIDYPDLEEHRQQHLEFTQKVLDFKVKHTCEKTLDTVELLNFLCDWLKMHILECDKAIGSYMRRVELGLG